ncbi:MAG: hypothetical protein E7571_08855 [Ruminococcaceae bacterium]|jgi:hypothetical protein|nr:hypothetical protein [Oscillospiraceae bacterium]
MKKFTVLLLCIVLVAGAFAACSGGNDNTEQDSIHKSETTEITTDPAKVKKQDAIDLISSYSAKELGLTKKEKKGCKFLVAGDGIKYKDNYYVKVVAATVVQTKEKVTTADGKTGYKTDIDEIAEYLIRYDGQEILGKKTDEKDYKSLTVKEVPTTEATTESTTKK